MGQLDQRKSARGDRQSRGVRGVDPLSSKASGYTWSDANGNGQFDPEEFRFATSGPKPNSHFLDRDFNLVFGRFHAWNHTYGEGKAWIGFDFKNALYATLPNAAPDKDVPVGDMTQVVLSTETMPEDPLGHGKQPWAPRSAPRRPRRPADERRGGRIGRRAS